MKTIISVANMNALDGHVVFALDITDALIQRVREAVEFLKDKEPNTRIAWDVDAHLYDLDAFSELPQENKLALIKGVFYLDEHPDILSTAVDIPLAFCQMEILCWNNTYSAYLKADTKDDFDSAFSWDIGELLRQQYAI